MQKETRREKTRKRRQTPSPPLHKEDKTSVDSSTLSLSLAGANAGKTTSSANAKNKDATLPLLSLGTVKTTAPLSSRAEPKSDTSVERENRSLSEQERAIAWEQARIANPDASAKDWAWAYRVALLKAGIKKGSINLGEVDLSLLSGTDVEENSGEDSDSSEDGMKVIRDDLERQNQVRSSASALKAESRAGDVTEHGDSMSAQHGSPSRNPLDIALLMNLQSAADVIRNCSSLSISSHRSKRN